MPSITLEVPGAGDDITSGLHASNYADLQALLNGGLDGSNLSSMGALNGHVLRWSGSAWVPGYLVPSNIAAEGATAGQVMTYNGTSWVPGASGPGDPVTTLPGSPVDKQQALLVDSLTAPTYAWVFQYESGISDANKWIYVGGSPLYAEVTTAQNLTAGTGYSNLTTTGPQVTAPRAGVYDIYFEAQHVALGTSAIGVASVKLGAAATADAESMNWANNTSFSERKLRRTLAASDVLLVQYKTTGAGNDSQWANRRIGLLPVRVA